MMGVLSPSLHNFFVIHTFPGSFDNHGAAR